MKIIALAAVGFLAYLCMRESRAPPKTLSGTKMVKLPARHSFSSNWKKDHPIPTNLFGSHPYGWSGFPAGAYLLTQPADD